MARDTLARSLMEMASIFSLITRKGGDGNISWNCLIYLAAVWQVDRAGVAGGDIDKSGESPSRLHAEAGVTEKKVGYRNQLHRGMTRCLGMVARRSTSAFYFWLMAHDNALARSLTKTPSKCNLAARRKRVEKAQPFMEIILALFAVIVAAFLQPVVQRIRALPTRAVNSVPDGKLKRLLLTKIS
jgi:hypothetical protein